MHTSCMRACIATSLNFAAECHLAPVENGGEYIYFINILQISSCLTPRVSVGACIYHRLTSQGTFGLLVQLSTAINLMASTALSNGDYTVGWVCALPKEQTAAIAMLDEIHPDLPKPQHDSNAYTLGRIDQHNVVIACLPMGMIGNNKSATVAAHMSSTFPSIKFGLMVGIGGGVPPKVRLGDIVVSKPVDTYSGVVQWDFGTAGKGSSFERIGSLNHPPAALLTALTKLQSKHDMQGSEISTHLEHLKKKWPKLASKYLRSDCLKDVLFRSSYQHIEKNTTENDKEDEEEEEEEAQESCTHCDPAQVVTRRPENRDMRIHYGLIASGNQVIMDAVRRNEINKMLGGNVLCFEMEAAGLMNDFPCLVIRGICDYADSHKNKNWQEHGAAVAAAFAKEFISMVPPHDVEVMPTVKSKGFLFSNPS